MFDYLLKKYFFIWLFILGVLVPVQGVDQSEQESASLYNKIICINLERSKDRKENILLQIKNHSIQTQFSFLSACDWIHLRDYGVPHKYKIYQKWKQEDSSNSWWNRELKLGEIACAISHMMAWREVANQECYTLILEDDAIFLENYNEKILNINKEMKNIKFDFLYFGRNDIGHKSQKVSNNVCIPSYSYRTHAYVISPTLAKRLLADNIYQDNVIPIDEYLPTLYCDHPREDIRSLFNFRLNTVYAIDPSIILQEEDIKKDSSLNSNIEFSDSFRL